jgi:hypothetical protein
LEDDVMDVAVFLIFNCHKHNGSCVDKSTKVRCEYYKTDDVNCHCYIGNPSTWGLLRNGKEMNKKQIKTKTEEMRKKVLCGHCLENADCNIDENEICEMIRHYIEIMNDISCPLYTDYRKSCQALKKHNKELGIMDESKLITVCDRCLKASCWKGQFFCDYAKVAGTTVKTVKELRELNLENECYWED